MSAFEHVVLVATGMTGPSPYGAFTGSVDEGVVNINVQYSPWGIDGDGQPYFDAAGAAEGEEAFLAFNTDGDPILVPVGGIS